MVQSELVQATGGTSTRQEYLDEDPDFPHLSFGRGSSHSTTSEDEELTKGHDSDADDEGHDSDADGEHVWNPAKDKQRSFKPKANPGWFRSMFGQPESELEEKSLKSTGRAGLSFVTTCKPSNMQGLEDFLGVKKVKPKRSLKKHDSLNDNTRAAQMMGLL